MSSVKRLAIPAEARTVVAVGVQVDSRQLLITPSLTCPAHKPPLRWRGGQMTVSVRHRSPRGRQGSARPIDNPILSIGESPDGA